MIKASKNLGLRMRSMSISNSKSDITLEDRCRREPSSAYCFISFSPRWEILSSFRAFLLHRRITAAVAPLEKPASRGLLVSSRRSAISSRRSGISSRMSIVSFRMITSECEGVNPSSTRCLSSFSALVLEYSCRVVLYPSQSFGLLRQGKRRSCRAKLSAPQCGVSSFYS